MYEHETKVIVEMKQKLFKLVFNCVSTSKNIVVVDNSRFGIEVILFVSLSRLPI